MTTNHLTSRSQETTGDHHRANPTTISHLPSDILYRIASKLPPKEFARTSVLSTEWRSGCTSSGCPMLTFDVLAMSKCKREEDLQYRHVWLFLSEVHDVLRKHSNKVVETLRVRIGFQDSTLLAHHVDAWVRFTTTSGTKNLVLDLIPERFWEYTDTDLYVFPFQLLDRETTSRLEHMTFSFVSLDPPSHFKGFPNLRRLHLRMVRVSRKDLENMLSHCYTLEWLYIHICGRLDRDDELIVDSPLPRLRYLRLEFFLSKIKFNAVNLATFEYDGSLIPIDLGQSLKLQSANIHFRSAVFQRALVSLLKGLPTVQNLTLNIRYQIIEKQWLWGNPLKFSNLRHLQLLMSVCLEDVDRILYSLAFLRATPFIEKLEVHFTGSDLWLSEAGPCRKDLVGQCSKYAHLKHIWITGFKAARGQLEFLLHVIENAPALQVLLVEIGPYSPYDECWSDPPVKKAKEIATTCMSQILPQNVTFHVKE